MLQLKHRRDFSYEPSTRVRQRQNTLGSGGTDLPEWPGLTSLSMCIDPRQTLIRREVVVNFCVEAIVVVRDRYRAKVIVLETSISRRWQQRLINARDGRDAV